MIIVEDAAGNILWLDNDVSGTVASSRIDPFALSRARLQTELATAGYTLGHWRAIPLFAATGELVARLFIWSSANSETVNGPAPSIAEMKSFSDWRLNVALDHVPAIISIKDLTGHFILTNREFERLHGRIEGNAVTDFDIHPRERAIHAANLEHAMISTGVWNEREVRVRDGEEDKIYHIRKFPILDEDKRVIAVGSIGTDVTDHKRLQAELQYRARHDPLTGLPNRTVLEERMLELLSRSRDDGAPHVFCFIDIDQFKVVNDTCGHAAGDRLLVELSRVMQAVIGDRYLLIRFGGDEFGLLLENCGTSEALAIAEQCRQQIENAHFSYGGRVFPTSASAGLAAFGDSNVSIEAVLSAADSACYMAKEAGRNRVHLFLPSDTDMLDRQGQMQWVAHINEALSTDGFSLYFQPIQPIRTTGKTHIEILSRMKLGDGPVYPPGSFMPAIERYNLARRFDRHVIDATFGHFARRPEKTNGLDLCSINLSGQTFSDESFIPFVEKQLEHHGFPPDKLCFEITETAAVVNLDMARKMIEQLNKWGVSFALDDFGRGLSSFAYLRALPVQYVKIDGLFVRNIAQDPVDRVFVQSISDICRSMGKGTVAEFVETSLIYSCLQEIGIDYAQGYAIGRPSPLENSFFQQ